MALKIPIHSISLEGTQCSPQSDNLTHAAGMITTLRIAVFLLLLTTLGFFYGITLKQNIISYMYYVSEENILNGFTSFMLSKGFGPIHDWSNKTKAFSTQASTVQEKILLTTINTPSSTLVSIDPSNPSDVLKEGDGIIFLETSNRLQLPPLVVCALESTARVYKNQPVAFFMKGLNDTNLEETVKENFPMLLPLKNIYFFPLRLEEVFADTPLFSWYMKINPREQKHWIHVSADACRLALIWKYGGIYMDTDFISIRPIPKQDFLAAEYSYYSSNGVFRFSAHHNFTQICMEDFVRRYNSRIWGHQGPHLFTRILKKFCDIPKFNGTEDIMCGNITFYNPQRFYPILYPSWKKYYQVWDKLPTFNDSYSLHLWNYMNRANVTMVPGSNTLVEHLYKVYCPSTYGAILQNVTTLQ
ncbi:alpha-1,4-N-acetylglucosaminyltransferase-like [Dendropsophus ebraccatus]|uniref:alpha-1,4-N-acetylglucosaminyltransferase-like n=1 Tax=Dendropsophus ebraccatus TaxID=150705 RepID=UPI003831399A